MILDPATVRLMADHSDDIIIAVVSLAVAVAGAVALTRRDRREVRSQANADAAEAIKVKGEVAESWEALLEVRLKLRDADWERKLNEALARVEREHKAEMQQLRAEMSELKRDVDVYGCENAPKCNERKRLRPLEAAI